MAAKRLLPFIGLLLCSVSAQGSWLDRWAVHGVIVQKTVCPSPLSQSLGIDAIYKLEVRDQRRNLHRQMVTREVFLAYEVGDHFDSTASLDTALANKTRPARKEPVKFLVKMKVDDSPEPPATGPRNRVASAYFTPDALPEREGF